MTAQMPETIWLDGQRMFMRSRPLEPHFSESGTKPQFVALSSACWRGYVGEWELKDGRLFLVAIKGMLAGGRKASVADIFPEGPFPIFAQWFSGTLQLPLGECLRYAHAGYASAYGDEIVLKFRRGILANQFRQSERVFGRLKLKLNFMLADFLSSARL